MSLLKNVKAEVAEKIHIIQGDITTLELDAIVNAANTGLLGGGGVDGAIHRAGGPEILEACRRIGGCKVGEAVLTTAGKMPAKAVIHTVGPIYKQAGSAAPQLLRNAYQNSLALAATSGFENIAFPNISTGVYGYPKKEAAKIALQATLEVLEKYPSLRKVCFCCFDKENFLLYLQEAAGITEEAFKQFTSFLPLLESQKKDELYTLIVDTPTLTPYVYTAKVERFVEFFTGGPFALSYTDEIYPLAGEVAKGAVSVEELDFFTILRLMHLHIRTERFNSGHIAHGLESGLFARMLKHLVRLFEA